MTQTWIAAAPRFTMRPSASERSVRIRLRIREVSGGTRAGAEETAIEWLPDLVERLIRSGRPRQARVALTNLEARAAGTRDPSILAAVARCRGFLAPDDSFERDFREALQRYDGVAAPFERARTELCFGERLRRARRRADSREHLYSALEAFEWLGADSWAARARRELAATGETLRSADLAPPDELTPQERQIALLVARGATNKEVGAALFLSPKTIEAHLGRVYRKLEIRSRTELAHAIATGRAGRP